MTRRSPAPAAWDEQPVRILTGSAALDGTLVIPAGARAIVLFAHGSGSGRHSPRNRFVAQTLHEAQLATLLIDLLTLPEEAVDASAAHLRFDIAFLAARLIAATDWLLAAGATRDLRIGYFGASTGAAAALVAAAEHPAAVGAIVSRGGRPDLARDMLGTVSAPTLLIVGGHDRTVLAVNEEALRHIRAEKRLTVVPGATHLFEEPGALETVAHLAADWFRRYLGPAVRPAS
ncbi:MAG TPA: dienelactone hydrolase family protein [bacterium]|nr:dienelactone hydrolase family protein [bacterium]